MWAADLEFAVASCELLFALVSLPLQQLFYVAVKIVIPAINLEVIQLAGKSRKILVWILTIKNLRCLRTLRVKNVTPFFMTQNPLIMHLITVYKTTNKYLAVVTTCRWRHLDCLSSSDIDICVGNVLVTCSYCWMTTYKRNLWRRVQPLNVSCVLLYAIFSDQWH